MKLSMMNMKKKCIILRIEGGGFSNPVEEASEMTPVSGV